MATTVEPRQLSQPRCQVIIDPLLIRTKVCRPCKLDLPILTQNTAPRLPPSWFDLCGDMIPWLKIVGLPLAYWDEDNLMGILKRYGKILVPADELSGGIDSSVLRIGVLTTRKNWLNVEVAVQDDGRFFNIGLVEYDRSWNPFSSPFQEDSGSEVFAEDCDDEDSKGDTEMEDSESEDLEEGEIPAMAEAPGGDEHGGVDSNGSSSTFV
ncbi:hypothetical protein LXL04_023631 [Taraxacum kok-saghyz]